jgi:hypothetical protein
VSDRWRVLKLRAYRRGDEGAFTPRPDMQRELEAIGWNWTRAGPPGPTWALIHAGTGKVAGMGGGVEEARGLWHLWCVLGPLGPRDWPAALQCARDVVRHIEHDFRGRRLAAYGRDDFPGAALVLRRLGFAWMGPSKTWEGYSVFERARGRRPA